LIGATRYKLADACGMQMQNLAEKAQNTGIAEQKTDGVENGDMPKITWPYGRGPLRYETARERGG
jgi:hypothetical protein